MVNKSIDWRRRRWRGEVPTEVLPEPVPLDSGGELHHVMVEAVRGLPPRQRAVIVLRYFEDLSEADTARAMDCAVGTVKSQTAKALARLRKHPQLADIAFEGAWTS
jgi:RNA polymerase sigma factor (sigma-70 family)